MIAIIQENYNGFDSHKIFDFEDTLPFDQDYYYQFTRKYKNEKRDCFRIYSDNVKKEHAISNSYFIGVDWIIENVKAIYVEPKLNKDCKEQTDYLKMLFCALKHPEVANHTADLFEIKWNKEPIQINQQQDILTPLLVVQYLSIVKEIVKKGLKKSYYKVEMNLYGKVKGKVLVGHTIKQNLFKNKSLNTCCSIDEFGINGMENRLLKKALTFIQRYLPTIKNLQVEKYTSDIFNYINPAFEFVSEVVNLHDIKNTKTNAFFKEYEEAIQLARIIIKRFGYNITNTEQKSIKTPPFWIDMSKLFELYVFGQLKDKYKNDLKFQFAGKGTFLDFLLTKPGEQTIIDTKYRPLYKDSYDIENIRQLSGYARDRKVLDELGYLALKEDELPIIRCLIIYPDQSQTVNEDNFENEDLPIDGFVKFYKRAIKLPIIET